MYKLKMDNPALPSGTEVQIHGLGFIKNGREEIIDDDRAQAFRGMNQRQETVSVDESGTIVQSVDGPTLLQAFKDHPFITVEVYKPEKAKKQTPAVEEQPAQPTDSGEVDNQGEGE